MDGPSTVTGHAVFQSTLSVRRATHQLCQLSKTIEVFQSTLSVRRATRVNVPVNIGGTISIHALRKESDPQQGMAVNERRDFNPRSP